MGIRMISIFSTCKPFREIFADTQRNAIESWTNLDLEVILIGDDEGTADVAQEFGCIHVPKVERRRAPLMDSLFRVARQYASHDILCYNNADIMLLSDFVWAVEKVAAKFPKQFLMIGQRWDTPIREPWDFSGRWEIRMMRFLKEMAHLHPPRGMDCLVWRRGLYEEIPPFGMGEAGYDSWLVWYAIEQGVPVIDCTDVVTFVHQWHPRPRDSVEHWRNKGLCTGRVKHIGHATWKFKKDGQIVKQ